MKLVDDPVENIKNWIKEQKIKEKEEIINRQKEIEEKGYVEKIAYLSKDVFEFSLKDLNLKNLKEFTDWYNENFNPPYRKTIFKFYK